MSTLKILHQAFRFLSGLSYVIKWL